MCMNVSAGRSSLKSHTVVEPKQSVFIERMHMFKKETYYSQPCVYANWKIWLPFCKIISNISSLFSSCCMRWSFARNMFIFLDKHQIFLHFMYEKNKQNKQPHIQYSLCWPERRQLNLLCITVYCGSLSVRCIRALKKTLWLFVYLYHCIYLIAGPCFQTEGFMWKRCFCCRFIRKVSVCSTSAAQIHIFLANIYLFFMPSLKAIGAADSWCFSTERINRPVFHWCFWICPCKGVFRGENHLLMGSHHWLVKPNMQSLYSSAIGKNI